MTKLHQHIFSIENSPENTLIRFLGFKIKTKRKTPLLPAPFSPTPPLLTNGKPVLFGNVVTLNQFEQPLSCTSQLCNQEFFGLPFFQYWARKFKNDLILHRKLWEFVYVTQVLHENNCLQPNKKGLVFGVGTEPLPALYASMGCEILATDLDFSNDRAKDWANTDQHIAKDILRLNERNICPNDVFLKNVKYRDVDMNNIPSDIRDFDFNWSSCSMEHLGGMDKSFDFLVNCLETLKPGGLAVHTTEFNLSSNNETSTDPYCCIFREKDILSWVKKITALGHYVYPLDLRRGTYVTDNYVDIPPYCKHKVHLRILLGQFASTSIGLIIRKKK